MTVAFGVDAGLAPLVAAELAAASVELGYGSLWVNDEPDAPGLETLALFSNAVPSLQLGVGVLPLHRYTPERIVADIERLGLDHARLWLGIGSGQLHPQFDILRRAVDDLRRMLPACRIVVAAVQPRMCHLAGAIGDAVLLNWMVPTYAATARGWVHEGAAEVGRAAPLVALYVRVAVGPDADQRLMAEEARYRELTDGQRRHFAAMGAPRGSVGVAALERAAVVEQLTPYQRSVDLVIVRALAEGDATVLDVARAAAPRSAHQ